MQITIEYKNTSNDFNLCKSKICSITPPCFNFEMCVYYISLTIRANFSSMKFIAHTYAQRTTSEHDSH